MIYDYIVIIFVQSDNAHDALWTLSLFTGEIFYWLFKKRILRLFYSSITDTISTYESQTINKTRWIWSYLNKSLHKRYNHFLCFYLSISWIMPIIHSDYLNNKNGSKDHRDIFVTFFDAIIGPIKQLEWRNVLVVYRYAPRCLGVIRRRAQMRLDTSSSDDKWFECNEGDES